MLKTIAAATAILLASAAPAQMPNRETVMAPERDAMKIFDWMNGQWRGEAVHRGPDGEKRVIHTERSGTMLEGTVRLIEGRAYGPDGGTPFNALAMISFDPATRQYRMASHAEGRFGVFAIVPSKDGYVWSVPAGPASINYTATFKDGVWTEVGDYLADGQPPRRIFRMEMRKIAETDWPLGGSVPPR